MINQVIISAAGLGLASLLGSVAGLVVKRVSHKWNDVFLGFCVDSRTDHAGACGSGCRRPVAGVCRGDGRCASHRRA